MERRGVEAPRASLIGGIDVIVYETWTEVHDEVQRQFVILETEVRRKLPGIRVAAGRTQGERFFLFSYRTFSLPDSALDPVVAGITFTPAEQGVTVEADVSGEGIGDRIFLGAEQDCGGLHGRVARSGTRAGAGALPVSRSNRQSSHGPGSRSRIVFSGLNPSGRVPKSGQLPVKGSAAEAATAAHAWGTGYSSASADGDGAPSSSRSS